MLIALPSVIIFIAFCVFYSHYMVDEDFISINWRGS